MKKKKNSQYEENFQNYKKYFSFENAEKNYNHIRELYLLLYYYFYFTNC